MENMSTIQTPSQAAVVSQKSKAGQGFQDLFSSLDVKEQGFLTQSQIIAPCQESGLSLKDPRMISILDNISKLENPNKISLDQFAFVVGYNLQLIQKVLKGELIIPAFNEFCDDIELIFNKTKRKITGKVADYIPQLKRVDPEKYAFSVCTIDGQQHQIGDAQDYFCVQSSCKPINYCIALNNCEETIVHQHVGHEPSGRSFNELTLNSQGLPHNPMINAGAIMTSSIIKPEFNIADRFEYVLNVWKTMSGGAHIGFNNAVYLSERQTADRNFALGYFMREHNAFPKNTNLQEVLEFYFQCCSIEINTKSMAIVASTLANGGVCPLTGEIIFSSSTVKNCLSLMYSCGMYDFSGEYSFSIGLPSKSGVSGVVITVIPNLMGMCTWSPRLDSMGNSVRGIEFFKELVNTYRFHNFDSLVVDKNNKKDPRKNKKEEDYHRIVDLAWAAARGDLKQLKYLVARGINLDISDYDGRTALHLAAAEGQKEVVNYLISKNVKLNPQDRWGGTPIKDAKQNGHLDIVRLLEKKKSNKKN